MNKIQEQMESHNLDLVKKNPGKEILEQRKKLRNEKRSDFFTWFGVVLQDSSDQWFSKVVNPSKFLALEHSSLLSWVGMDQVFT